jgi:glutamyl-tRNA reductase
VTRAQPDSIVAFVTHARHVPEAERERFALRLSEGSRDGILVLQTCHRVEAYVVPADRDADLGNWLPAGGRRLVGEVAVRHAMTVAVGRDSVVIGEDQILHQLRESVDSVRTRGHLDPVLERLFAIGLRAGRRARSWRDGKGRSLADVAITAIGRRSGPLGGREILIVGAGKMGGLSVAAGGAAGASVSIANRSPAGAIAIAARSGARIDAFDPGAAIDRYAAVIVAIVGPWTIDPATMDALEASETIIVDLSVPAAVPTMLVERIGPRLISADDLAVAESDSAAPNTRSIARLDALVDEATAEFRSWLEIGDGRAAAAALAARADRDRHAELDQLWRQLPDLDARAREAIELMSGHLARRLLREPLERLGHDHDGRHERAARELFGL